MPLFGCKVLKKQLNNVMEDNNNPMNYRARGFRTSADLGIFADESVGLPHPDCLMIRELVPGGLESVHGYINYKMYEALR